MRGWLHGAGGRLVVARRSLRRQRPFPLTSSSTANCESELGDCNDGRVDWTTIDINRDGWLDLVITDGASCDSDIGNTEWSVHYGAAEGFTDSAQVWSLPGELYGGNGPFPLLSSLSACAEEIGDCNAGRVDWATIDLNNDGWLDLVITDGANCDSSNIGNTEWSVHYGADGGFADNAQVWSLPGESYGGDGPFPHLSGEGDCNDGRVDWATIDINNDGWLDLVITDGANCDSSNIGNTEWSVHYGADGGFADTAQVWSLPGESYGGNGPFPLLSSGNSCDNSLGDCNDGRVDWATTDINNDGWLDLVITDGANCDSSNIGNTEWSVHYGANGGFADNAQVWSLPGKSYGGNGPFPLLSSGNSCDNSLGDCNDGRVDWAAIDINNDGWLDLVITDGANCDSSNIGNTEWGVHRSCMAG